MSVTPYAAISLLAGGMTPPRKRQIVINFNDQWSPCNRGNQAKWFIVPDDSRPQRKELLLQDALRKLIRASECAGGRRTEGCGERSICAWPNELARAREPPCCPGRDRSLFPNCGRHNLALAVTGVLRIRLKKLACGLLAYPIVQAGLRDELPASRVGRA